MSVKLLPAALVCSLLFVPATTRAQDIDTIPIPIGELSFGYTFLRDFGGPTDALDFPAGWTVSGAFNLNRWFALVGEATGSYRNDYAFDIPGQMGGEMREFLENVRTDFRTYSVMGGPRFFFKSNRVVPFVQVLAGGVRLSEKVKFIEPGYGLGPRDASQSYFGLQSGGGVTVYLTNQVGVRFSADHRLIVDFDDDGNSYGNQFRAGAGIVFGWGRR